MLKLVARKKEKGDFNILQTTFGAQENDVSSYLKKFGDIRDDISENKLFLFGIEPSKFCDSREQGNQTLNKVFYI